MRILGTEGEFENVCSQNPFIFYLFLDSDCHHFQGKKSLGSICKDFAGQMIIFHQPRFSGHKGISLPSHLLG